MLLILYPSGINWFHEAVARNIHDELVIENYPCRLITPDEFVSVDAPDLVEASDILVVNSIECAHELAGPVATAARREQSLEALLDRIRRFRRRILLNIDGIQTGWFSAQVSRMRTTLTDIFDLCMVQQVEQPTVAGCRYTWIPESFTRAERENLLPRQGDRPIAWAMVAHATRDRVEIADELVRRVSPSGLVFMPGLRPYDAAGSQSLSAGALDRVLRQSCYYVWSSHHRSAYHEGLRSLHAVKNGAIPVKIDPHFASAFRRVPWVYESVTAFRDAVDADGPDLLYRRAAEFVLSQGALGSHLVRALVATEHSDNAESEGGRR
jgi:hypothetical protein